MDTKDVNHNKRINKHRVSSMNSMYSRRNRHVKIRAKNSYYGSHLLLTRGGGVPSYVKYMSKDHIKMVRQTGKQYPISKIKKRGVKIFFIVKWPIFEVFGVLGHHNRGGEERGELVKDPHPSPQLLQRTG